MVPARPKNPGPPQTTRKTDFCNKIGHKVTCQVRRSMSGVGKSAHDAHEADIHVALADIGWSEVWLSAVKKNAGLAYGLCQSGVQQSWL
jgi:hypothetical protein